MGRPPRFRVRSPLGPASHRVRRRRPGAFLLLASLMLAVMFVAGCGQDADRGTAAGDSGEQLLAVAEAGDLQALDRLLGRSSDVDVRNVCDWTPLMNAALNGHDEAVERLLAAGAAVDAMDKGGYTALMLAASNDHAGVVRRLLAHGAMVDAQERTQGFTALIWAAQLGHRQTVDVLLAHGADLTLPDLEGRTALDHARAGGHGEVAARIAAAGEGAAGARTTGG